MKRNGTCVFSYFSILFIGIARYIINSIAFEDDDLMLTTVFTFFTRVFQALLAVLLLGFVIIGMLATHGIYTAETTNYAQYRPQAEVECADAADIALCVKETLADMGSVKLILGLGVSAGIISTIILVIWVRNWMRNRQKNIAN